MVPMNLLAVSEALWASPSDVTVHKRELQLFWVLEENYLRFLLGALVMEMCPKHNVLSAAFASLVFLKR